jgi:hypothetical protein
MKRILCLLPLLALPGCIVHTAYDVATAPVRVASWTVDRLTTSQAEADRNRGRRERKEEEKQRRQSKREAKRQRDQEKTQSEPQ